MNLAELIEAYKGKGGALFRPSAIDRTINCPGWLQLAATLPATTDKQSVYAAEGTLAHRISEAALKNEQEPVDWIGKRCEVGEYTFYPDEMFIGHINTYLDLLAENWHPRKRRYSEQTLGLRGGLIYRQNRGTIDVLDLDYEARVIDIWDLKFGTGVRVSRNAPQLKDYALIVLDNYHVKGGWKLIRLHVVQPRLADWKHEPVVYEPYELFDDFADQLTTAMHRAVEPDPPLHTGSWCKWCPAAQARICPLLQAEALHIADEIDETQYRASTPLPPIPDTIFIGNATQPMPMTSLPKGTVILPDPSGMTEAQISRVLKRRHLWDTWIAAVEHHAVNLMEYGTASVLREDWKLSRRTKRRVWLNQAEALTALMQMGLTHEQIYSPSKLRTVKQIENFLTLDQRHDIKPLYHTPLGDILLLPADSAKEGLLPVLGPIEDTEAEADTEAE